MKSVEFQFLNLTSKLTSGVSLSESNTVNFAPEFSNSVWKHYFESLEIVKNENIT